MIRYRNYLQDGVLPHYEDYGFNPYSVTQNTSTSSGSVTAAPMQRTTQMDAAAPLTSGWTPQFMDISHLGLGINQLPYFRTSDIGLGQFEQYRNDPNFWRKSDEAWKVYSDHKDIFDAWYSGLGFVPSEIHTQPDEHNTLQNYLSRFPHLSRYLEGPDALTNYLERIPEGSYALAEGPSPRTGFVRPYVDWRGDPSSYGGWGTSVFGHRSNWGITQDPNDPNRMNFVIKTGKKEGISIPYAVKDGTWVPDPQGITKVPFYTNNREENIALLSALLMAAGGIGGLFGPATGTGTAAAEGLAGAGAGAGTAAGTGAGLGAVVEAFPVAMPATAVTSPLPALAGAGAGAGGAGLGAITPSIGAISSVGGLFGGGGGGGGDWFDFGPPLWEGSPAGGGGGDWFDFGPPLWEGPATGGRLPSWLGTGGRILDRFLGQRPDGRMPGMGGGIGMGGDATGLLGLLSAIYGGRQSREYADMLRQIAGQMQEQANPFLSRLRESYENPEAYLQSPEMRAILNLEANRLAGIDAAQGRLSNDIARTAKLQQLAQSRLADYRRGLQQSIASVYQPRAIADLFREAAGRQTTAWQGIPAFFGSGGSIGSVWNDIRNVIDTGKDIWELISDWWD